MTELTPGNIAKYLSETRPDLIKHIVKAADPGMAYLFQLCEDIKFGKVEFTITVRGGVIEGIETVEKKKWVRTFESKSPESIDPNRQP